MASAIGIGSIGSLGSIRPNRPEVARAQPTSAPLTEEPGRVDRANGNEKYAEELKEIAAGCDKGIQCKKVKPAEKQKPVEQKPQDESSPSELVQRLSAAFA